MLLTTSTNEVSGLRKYWVPSNDFGRLGGLMFQAENSVSQNSAQGTVLVLVHRPLKDFKPPIDRPALEGKAPSYLRTQMWNRPQIMQHRSFCVATFEPYVSLV